ncbi:hypothetical protein ACS0TY_022509 [Phlomoides rotata]
MVRIWSTHLNLYYCTSGKRGYDQCDPVSKFPLYEAAKAGQEGLYLHKGTRDKTRARGQPHGR